MKNLIAILAIAIISPATWALADANCGTVNGKNMDIYAGPQLAIDGNPIPLTEYASTESSTYYVSADGQYIWAVNNGSRSALYDGNRKLLAYCHNNWTYQSGDGDNGASYDPGPFYP